ncbi:MAG: methyl-accepting chemotaxis protein, partial [Rhodoferax sp.]|nr:methyl-accepting chemotaxis protein [Rhodoferax sp.]
MHHTFLAPGKSPHWLLRPGIAIAMRTKLGTRILLLTVVMAVPMAFLFYQQMCHLAGGCREQPELMLVVTLLVVGLFGLLGVYGLLCLYVNNEVMVEKLKRGVQSSAEGDLSARGYYNGTDNLGELGSDFERMLDNLSDMTAQVRAASAQLGESGRGLVEDTRALAERAQTQGINLQQTALHVRRVSETV